MIEKTLTRLRTQLFDLEAQYADTLNAYKSLLLEWGKKINLVSRGTFSHLQERHIRDALQVAVYLQDEKFSMLVDCGSGAGLPGIPLAILGYPVRMIEIDQKKVAFIKMTLSVLKIDAEVLCQRIEDMDPVDGRCGYLSRAVMPLHRFFDTLPQDVLLSDAFFMLHKGERLSEELDIFHQRWEGSFQEYPSLVHDKSFLIKLDHVRQKDSDHCRC